MKVFSGVPARRGTFDAQHLGLYPVWPQARGQAPVIEWLSLDVAQGDSTMPLLSACTLTKLNADGTGKADADASKIMIGKSAGWPICIAPRNDLLGLAITEGIEDGLSVHQAWRIRPRRTNLAPSATSVLAVGGNVCDPGPNK